MEGWSDLFVASAGASAALAGLVFVAVSINVDRIIGYAGLPERALVTVLLLLGVVVVSIVALAPGVSEATLGLLLLIEAVLLAAVVARLTWHGRPRDGSDGESQLVGAATIAALGTLPFVVGAIVLLTGDADGLYWTLGGMIAAIVGAVANAWVLLVEILR